ncbi:MAG TPA: PA0069 family radical SAM protein [Rhodanobacteraceae bacterium]|nr:PA0069 family radical SAM protein [Rhodanobacteraceae bacterium]
MPAQQFPPPAPYKGRGALSNPEGRFEPTVRRPEDDGWSQPGMEPEAGARPETTVSIERARSIISRNDSPDVPFEQSINPYRGCEHGCVYCYARPSHAYLNLSPGLDFETKLFAKTNAAVQLRVELARAGYRCSPLNLGANTDPYQPVERRLKITRSILEVLLETKHPCTIVSKNALVERDLDLLVPMARERLVHVFVSCAHLDNRLAAKLEPRASAPHRRIRAIKALNDAGVPCGVLVAPIIPALNDRHMEHVLQAAAEAGAKVAGYTTLRLPHELKQLFREWLAAHVPQRADHVMSLVQQMNRGRDYDPDFRTRMRGQGVFAQLLARRFEVACSKYGFARRGGVRLDTSCFIPPRKPSSQGELF